MQSTNSQESKFILFTDHDIGNAEAFRHEMEEEHQTTFIKDARSNCFPRASCWVVCSATAIYATKRLMVTHGFHFPLTIAFHSFAAILIVYIISLRLPADIQGRLSQWGVKQPDGDYALLNKYWIFMIPASLAAAASLPMLLEGLLHMPSLPVLVMLFPLIYSSESLALFICCSPSRARKWVSWEAAIATLASSVVLYNEYRLMVPGLVWGITGTLLTGLSRACFTIGSERCGSETAVQARLKAYHGFSVMTLVFGLIISGVMAYQFEHNVSIRSLSWDKVILMLINILSFIGTTFSGTFILAYSPISFRDSTINFSNIPIPVPELLASSSSGLLVTLVAISSTPIPYLSWIQIAAYIVANMSLTGSQQIYDYVLTCRGNTQKEISKSFGDEQPIEKRKPSKVVTGAALFCLVIFSSWTVSLLSSASINSLPPSMPTRYDLNYHPESSFDIVISMYEEDPVEVKSMLERIKSTTLLSIMSPRVIIYTKNLHHDLAALQKVTGADVVERLPNLGREGGTYLWHIVNKWDQLARQTMFIQAHAHNMRELIPRISSYLVPDTGMLSLGFPGVTCSCNSCGDRWGWEDGSGVVPDLYGRIYAQDCTSETKILLSYKGQFVASARRIRGISKTHYSTLLETITSTESRSKTATGRVEIEGGVTGENTPDNPYFGFTMERVWGLLLQCGTDGRVASRCPSLLSGMGRGGKVSDCQCLDTMA